VWEVLGRDLVPSERRQTRDGEERKLLIKLRLSDLFMFMPVLPGVEAKAAVGYALGALELDVGTRGAVACIGCD
jgi:hypothetical protein